MLDALVIFSCSSEPDPPAFDLRADFVPHVDQFIEEGRKRGHDIDFSDTGLSIQFSEKADDESSGVCFVGQHRIEIDRKDWNGLSFVAKEGLIFHELGHCELGREHVNHLLSNGEWASRMRGEPFLDESMSTIINYSARRRDYYIDELFDQNTPEPDWVNITQEYDIIDDSQRREIVFIEETTSFAEIIPLGASADFEIELEMNNSDTEEFIAVVWGEDNNERSFRIGYNRLREFVILSGDDIWGLMHEIIEFGLVQNDIYNKLTVRKIDDLYYIFVNEQFVYWLDFNGQPIGMVQSLERGDVNYFRNVRVSELML